MSNHATIETYEQYWAMVFGPHRDPKDVVANDDCLCTPDDIKPFVLAAEREAFAQGAQCTFTKLMNFRIIAAEDLHTAMVGDDKPF
jgi:hypothetical protein